MDDVVDVVNPSRHCLRLVTTFSLLNSHLGMSFRSHSLLTIDESEGQMFPDLSLSLVEMLTRVSHSSSGGGLPASSIVHLENLSIISWRTAPGLSSLAEISLMLTWNGMLVGSSSAVAERSLTAVLAGKWSTEGMYGS